MVLNVCGLLSRLDIQDFREKIQQYDIICFCETKTDDADTENVSNKFESLGFRIFIRNRHNLTTRRSGGVIIAYKEKLTSKCKRMKCQKDSMAIVKLDKSLLNLEKHILLIAMYLPPFGTRYSNVEMFNDLSDEVLNYSKDDYYHLVCGDLNAHTGTKTDIVNFDPMMCDSLGIDEDTRHRLEITQTLKLLNLPLGRHSMDKSKDRGNYGASLLDLCRNNLLCIFNGRSGSDAKVGKATSTDDTLID